MNEVCFVGVGLKTYKMPSGTGLGSIINRLDCNARVFACVSLTGRVALVEAGGDLSQGVSPGGVALQVGGRDSLRPLLLLQVAGSDLLADGGLQQAVG